MNNWLTARELENTPTVLVTVASVEGSGPRETGAKMLVTAHTQIDTIGGGHLEHRACEIAREMLAAPADDNWNALRSAQAWANAAAASCIWHSSASRAKRWKISMHCASACNNRKTAGA
jgi:xanthine dehydrogenase accessory factor